MASNKKSAPGCWNHPKGAEQSDSTVSISRDWRKCKCEMYQSGPLSRRRAGWMRNTPLLMMRMNTIMKRQITGMKMNKYASMPYDERVRHYEAEKALLQQMGLDPFEYERLLRKAAEKWRI